MANQKYYLGIDPGTGSAGWAVSGKEYERIRRKGQDMWGVHEFDEADTSVKKRAYHTSRRKKDRHDVQVGMLKSYFDEPIRKEDENFFVRMENSRYFMEDKDPRLCSKNGLFDDENYKDADYYKEFPTIYHLRVALMDLEDTGRTFDARHVYLAIKNMFDRRGHFCLSSDDDDMNKVQTELAYQELLEKLKNDYGVVIDPKPFSSLTDIIGSRDMGIMRKYKTVSKLYGVTSKNKSAHAFLRCMCGMKTNVKLFFDTETDEEVFVTFHDYAYVDKIPELTDNLTEAEYAVIEQMKSIYDYAILDGILRGYDYLSCARVDMHKKHHSELRLLKDLYRKYKTKGDYNRMFCSDADGTYSAYANSLNSSDSLAESNKYRRNMKGRTAEALYDTIKRDLKGYEEDDDVKYVLEQIETGQFLPKQLTGENGVIPNQVHNREMKRILSKAEQYHPFLKEKDESGLTVSERIYQLFTFQIPYYVGPTGKGAKTGWAVRREEGAILPWNINEKIDMKATSEAFITNLIRSCTFMNGEKVMPKASLAYERYCVLNEINTLCIDGERIDTELKQRIYKDCFMPGKKLTKKQLCAYLISEGVIHSEEQVTGVDKKINSSLSSYGKMYAIFGEKLQEEETFRIAEDIIYWATVFSGAREMLKKHLEKYVEQNILTEKDVKRILGYRFEKWGRYSKALLELQGCEKATKEVFSLEGAMWKYSLNFNELINSNDFTFKDAVVGKYMTSMKTLSEFTYEDLEGSYYSAPVKRMIWQTLLLVKEIIHVMGCAPERIFVEMMRSDDEKGDAGRKSSRGKKLLKLYKDIPNTATHNWKEEIEQADESGRLKSTALYLYYTQMGRDMYTGKEIDLADVFNKNLYDIDHIYPQHYVKDDSEINNLALVDKQINEHLKKDLYPIPEKIAFDSKVRELWDSLYSHGLISDEKYKRLISRRPFTEKQLGDFIARQLVETAQGAKSLAGLLKQLLPETEIVYVKGANVTEFRNKFDFPKSRIINEFHHAQDAYLNIVVGNVYYTKFTKDPWNFVRKEYAQDKEKNHYHLGKMYDWNVIRGDETAWIAETDSQPGTIEAVREMMERMTPLLSFRNFEYHSELADINAMSAKVAKPGIYLPIKTTDAIISDVTKYGGYKNKSIAYFFIVRHKEKKKEMVTIESLPLCCKEEVESTPDGLEKYCTDVLGYKDVEILRRKLKKKSLVEVNGFRMYLTGKTGNAMCLQNATSLCLPTVWNGYIRKLEKAVDKDGYIDKKISSESNVELYDLLVDKHLNTIFAKRPVKCGEKLQKRRDVFVGLEVKEQCSVLLQILQLTGIGKSEANLELIGESKHSCKLVINKKITPESNFTIIDQSVTGLYEKRVRIF